MTTFYSGLRPVLKGRSDTANTYTGLIGRYSNWDLMYSSHVLDGAPNKNHVPGVPQTSGGGEGDVVLSGMFNGTLNFVYPLAGPYNAVAPSSVNYFYGNYPSYEYHGLKTNYSGQNGTIDGHRPIVNSASYGHLGYSPNLTVDASGNPVGMGTESPYRQWDYYYHGLANNEGLKSSTLGHVVRFTAPSVGQYGLADLGQPWDTGQQAATFGSFQPYLYKGVAKAFGRVGGGSAEEEFLSFGHVYAAANSVGTSHDVYGDEHTREWFGVPSAKALGGGVAASGSNSYSNFAPKL